MSYAIVFNKGCDKIIHFSDTKEQASTYMENYILDYVKDVDGRSSNLFVTDLIIGPKNINKHLCLTGDDYKVYHITKDNDGFFLSGDYKSSLVFTLRMIPVEESKEKPFTFNDLHNSVLMRAVEENTD